VTRLSDWAVVYVRAGWPVFPLAARSKVPLIPKDKGGNGFHDATTDEAQIVAWWSQYPEANIGIAFRWARRLSMWTPATTGT
jgi:hypothetical protein